MTIDNRSSILLHGMKYSLGQAGAVFVLLLLSLSLLSCGGKSGEPELGGESHFLSACPCSDGLKCMAGVCTRPCNSNSECRDLANNATCVENTDGPMCDVECGSTLECTELGSDFECRDEVCRVGQRQTERDAAAPRADADTEGDSDDDAEDDTDVKPCDAQASPFGGGEGTEADPYTLCTAAHLSALQGEHLSKYFLLVQDLDLQNVAFELINEFTGVFDGGGHRISNLFIDFDNSDVGLFGRIEAGVVRNLELFEPEVRGGWYVGALAGRLEEGEVSDVSVIGASVSNGVFIGGLVGVNTGNIGSSSFTGSVSGNTVGGLVGSNDGFITRSFAIGDVSGVFDVGGLVGGSNGLITNSYATGSVSGDYTVGGLVGNHWGNITNSYTTGVVISNFESGGLVGSSNGGIMSSYFNATSSLDNGAGVPLSCVDFAEQSNFVGWDFENTWRMAATRPVLAWQEDPELPDNVCTQ